METFKEIIERGLNDTNNRSLIPQAEVRDLLLDLYNGLAAMEKEPVASGV